VHWQVSARLALRRRHPTCALPRHDVSFPSCRHPARGRRRARVGTVGLRCLAHVFRRHCRAAERRVPGGSDRSGRCRGRAGPGVVRSSTRVRTAAGSWQPGGARRRTDATASRGDGDAGTSEPGPARDRIDRHWWTGTSAPYRLRKVRHMAIDARRREPNRSLRLSRSGKPGCRVHDVDGPVASPSTPTGRTMPSSALRSFAVTACTVAVAAAVTAQQPAAAAPVQPVFTPASTPLESASAGRWHIRARRRAPRRATPTP
jgi:hypothetical protein